MTLPLTSDIRPPISSSGSDAEVLVKVEGVSKKFCRDLKKSLWYGVKDVASELLPFGRQKTGIRGQGSGGADSFSSLLTTDTRHLSPDSSSLTPVTRLLPPEPALRAGEFWANKDISFELRRGECLGLIGRNGAGKTTLLKMLNGLIKPDAGSIEMRGRVGALIALGAGFNPILSGRENIYVNGSILGLTKEEIDSKIDDIIDFAEIPDFIDSPVQSYSSGMQVRLGFAVATALEPDVLILDEVLAVGDAAFRAKCYKRIGQIQHKAAVIFVSHSMDQVGQVCTNILGLSHGRGEVFPSKDLGLQWYSDQNLTTSLEENGIKFSGEIVNNFECSLENESITYASSADLKISIDTRNDISNVSIRVLIYDTSGLVICEWNSLNHNLLYNINTGGQILHIKLGPLLLKSGNYTLGVWLQAEHRIEPLGWSLHQLHLSVVGPTFGHPNYILPL